jgi:hypothetical protein
MSKRTVLFILIIISPLLTMIIVNECFDTPQRTHEYHKEHCTWYCHDVACPHWADDYRAQPTPAKKIHKDIFDWYVINLLHNPLGLNYGMINLLVFVFFYPLLGSLLVWNLIRNKK